jgi:hypothetical protein
LSANTLEESATASTLTAILNGFFILLPINKNTGCYSLAFLMLDTKPQ